MVDREVFSTDSGPNAFDGLVYQENGAHGVLSTQLQAVSREAPRVCPTSKHAPDRMDHGLATRLGLDVDRSW